MSTYRTSCGETLEKLPLYVGGDLDPEALATVRAHLALCASCARRARAGERARQELASSLASPAAGTRGSSLWPGIRSELLSEGLIQPDGKAAGSPTLRRARGRLRWLVPLAAAAALLAVLQGTGLLSRARPADVAPPAPEIAAPSAPSGGTLRRIGPNEVEQLVPPQSRRPTFRNEGWLRGAPVSTAGFRRQ